MSLLLFNQHQNQNRSLYIKSGIVIDADLVSSNSYTADYPFMDRIYWGRVVHVASSHVFVKLSKNDVGLLPNEPSFPKLKEGQAVLVQVRREPIPDRGTAHKGPVLTQKITLAGRFCLFHPLQNERLLSKKIQDQPTRSRLLSLFSSDIPITLRESAAQASAQDIQDEFQDLQHKYLEINKPSKQLPFSTPYDHIPAVYRWIRDLKSYDSNQILVDSDALYKEIHDFTKQHRPDLLTCIHKSKGSVLKSYDMEDFWDSLFLDVFQLPSGGNIVFDVTAAAIVIDINQGNKEPRETNKEAIPIIAQQLKCRHLGGNIIIDFIGLEGPYQHREYIIELLNSQAQIYNLPIDIFGWSKLGWLEARLPKRRQPLQYSLT